MRCSATSFVLLSTMLFAIAPRAATAEKPASLAKGIPYQQQIILGSDDPRCSAFGYFISGFLVPMK